INAVNEYKLLRGEDMSRYSIDFSALYCKFDKNNSLKFKDVDLYFTPKLLIRRVGNELMATFDDNNYVVLNAIYCGLTSNRDYALKYIVALLNSKLTGYWFKNMFVLTDKLFPYIRKSQ